MPHQGGLAGLAWSCNDNHWIAAGEVLKPGFGVSGDVGHGGFSLLCMPTLCDVMANCQSNYQLAYTQVSYTLFHFLRKQDGVHLEVKSRKVAWGAVYQRSIGNFFELFEEISEQGIFNGITNQ